MEVAMEALHAIIMLAQLEVSINLLYVEIYHNLALGCPTIHRFIP